MKGFAQNTLFLFMLLGQIVCSQSAYPENDLKIGLQTGLQLSNFVNGLEYTNSELRSHFGLNFYKPLNDYLAIEPQILFIKKGGSVDYRLSPFYDGEINFRLKYIEIPVLLNFHFNPSVGFLVGPYFSYLVDTDFTFNTPFTFGGGELNYNQFEPFEFGLIGGISFRTRRGQIALKYVQGFTDIAKDDNALLLLENAKNNMFMISFVRYFGQRRRR